ncbi:hypothetical protein WOLCODRAFT_19627 [Wolfiporia cocos MD-104 SS10]|uniref:DUF2470 domain-containing protein n=1 Tax=Wolfiporia cocos (strain MD-104) TaxID=742152 RepID=A0A2H3J807_WOLCO|nr:hypothetical protein WOLCODRAFT_19627 [Wolfiporia cocos MD-104 SS10]
MSDPVAAKSGFLCMYMSNHPDTLVAYVRHWGNVTDKVSNAAMTSIDSNTKSSGDLKKEIRIVFDPPLAGYEEVKPRLLSMKVDAEEALGMARAPQITTFQMPSQIIYTGSLIASLCYMTYAPVNPSPEYALWFYPANYLRQYLPYWAVAASWYFLVFVHAMEALYALTLCIKHQTPLLVGVQYVLFTAVFGFPVLGELRRQKQVARIDSILKGK